MATDIQKVLQQVEKNNMTAVEAFEYIRSIKQGRMKKHSPSQKRILFSRVYQYGEPYMKDHQGENPFDGHAGSQVLLGVTHCSMALEAGWKLYQESREISIHKLLLQNPVVVYEGETVNISVEIEKKDGSILFENTYRKGENGQSQPAASGELRVGTGIQMPVIDIEGFKAASTGYITSPQAYKRAEALRGDSLRTVRNVYISGDEALGELLLDSEYNGGSQGYRIPPALLDGGFVSSLAVLETDESPVGGEGLWVPFMFKEAYCYGSLPSKCFCHIKRVKSSKEVFAVDISFCDQEGRVILKIGEFTYRFVKKEMFAKGQGIKAEQVCKDTGSVAAGSIQEEIAGYLAAKIAGILGTESKTLRRDKNFMDLGVDSNSLIILSGEIEKELNLELYPTLFFEYQNIDELSVYFHTEFGEKLKKYFKPAPMPGNMVTSRISVREKAARPSGQSGNTGINKKDIAIIGMGGRFAGTGNLEEFWESLRSSGDLITEIPGDHWDWRPWFDANRDASNKTYSKWGSFIEVDKFDPLFFGISPKEALWMDPQLRLLLEVVYSTMGDAGYEKKIYGSNTGVFVGRCFQEYWDEIVRNNVPIVDYQANSCVMSALSGRLSYMFDLQGQSIPIDNACASSLTAIHLACKALRNNECDMAFAAGVNLLLSPLHYVYTSRMQALSPTGRCHTFDKKADGYVPGEGVAALLLKPLYKAVEDNDNIHAVIKGTASNHVGRSNNPTSPRPELQTRLLQNAWEDAGVSPDTITYIEAHGTGTTLGDPIEINALKKAFESGTSRRGFCAIGSAKAHIGHTEAAAGIAGVIKTVLSLKHGQIPRMPLFEELNPYINLEESPFYINTELIDWKREDNIPRRAGVSSFGITGNNTHVVLEEYIPYKYSHEESIILTSPYIFVLSAKNEVRLNVFAAEMVGFLSGKNGNKPDLNLRDIVYTLQTGRESMEERLAILAYSTAELIEKLERYCKGEKQAAGLFRGCAGRKTGNMEGKELQNDVEPDSIARFWVEGGHVEWQQLYGAITPKLVSLPTYPFEKERYWMPEFSSAGAENERGGRALHMLIDSNSSTLEEYSFKKNFSEDCFYIRNCSANGKNVVSEAVFVEMARLAGELASKEGKVARIEDIKLGDPFFTDNTLGQVSIVLYPEDMGVMFELEAAGKDKTAGILAQGKLLYADSNTEIRDGSIDLGTVRGRCSESAKGIALYDKCTGKGQKYAAAYEVLREIHFNEREAVADLFVPEIWYGHEKNMVLHPALLEGAFQAAAYHISGMREGAWLPRAIGSIEILKPLVGTCCAYVHGKPAGDGIHASADIVLASPGGEVLVRINDILLEAYELKISSNAGERLHFYTSWEETPVSGAVADYEKALITQVLVFDTNEVICRYFNNKGIKTILVRAGSSFRNMGEGCYEINPSSEEDYARLMEVLGQQAAEPRYIVHLWSKSPFSTEENDMEEMLEKSFYSLFRLTKALMKSKTKGGVRLVYAYDTQLNGQQPQYGAIGGFAKTVAKENPRFIYKTVGVSLQDAGGEKQGKVLLEELQAGISTDPEILYSEGKRYVKRIKEHREGITAVNTPYLKHGGVYIITGGAGGLGYIFAEHIARQVSARLVLAGRSEISPKIREMIEKLGQLGAEVQYIQGDVSKKEDVFRIVREVKNRWGRLDGILHSAGVIRDAFLLGKNVKEMEEVLAPKVYGTVWLDEATKDEPLDFFIMFSSIAGAIGNMGQCDYAYGNSFMDHYGFLRAERGRAGKTVSINWPLWESGGMQISQTIKEKLLKETGLDTIPAGEGFKALQYAVNMGKTQCIVAYGTGKAKQYMENGGIERIENDKTENKNIDTAYIREGIEELLRDIFGGALNMAPEKLDKDVTFYEYGVDSIIVHDFNQKMEKKLKKLPKTLLFEYQTLGELMEYFMENHAEELGKLFDAVKNKETGPENTIGYDDKEAALKSLRDIRGTGWMPQIMRTEACAEEDIAIIGLSGRYPQARNLKEFWENLKLGKDCIEEVPSNRWSLEEYYNPNPSAAKNGQMYCKWGGFLEDIDRFEPLFFNISPREAETMDPQERIFLQTAWAALEDAGYTTKQLQQYKSNGNSANVGVFAGVTSYTYMLLGPEEWRKGNYVMPSSLPWSMANRVSYIFNLNGPSVPVDTACSSSLTAIHMACESLKRGECEIAITGGVNLYLHPSKYIWLSQVKMLSPTGRCHSFGSAADGFVPGEGVGAAILKPLSKAVRDRDHIYAVIKSSAINHGGFTNGFTVPSPNAQASVISQALEKAGINPRTISYIEAHGTGTSLGDPIEISGLTKAYRAYTRDSQYCSIGSVKSNIGHLEAAAGISALTKVVLQLQNKQLVPSLHSENLNPDIDFEESPFHVQRELSEWKQDNGSSCPRRAGISSFGAGGANAHIIVEEYLGKMDEHKDYTKERHLVILSARNESRLKSYAAELAQYIEENPSGSLRDIAYTLQTGREAMDERLAIVASDMQSLAGALCGVANGDYNMENVHRGSAKGRRSKRAQPTSVVASLDMGGGLEQIAEQWVSGMEIAWDKLYGQDKPYRISLPSYPFAGDRYWIPKTEEACMCKKTPEIHVPTVESCITNDKQSFRTELTGNEFYLRDHIVAGKKILPGVVYLEMARAAGEAAVNRKVSRIRNIVWTRPVVAGDSPCILNTRLYQDEDGMNYEISMQGSPDNPIVHGQGALLFEDGSDTLQQQHIPPEVIKKRCRLVKSGTEYYELFEKKGLKYGESFRPIQHIYCGQGEAMSLLKLPLRQEESFSQFVLHPSIMDGALQTVIALMDAESTDDGSPYIPFAMGELEICCPLENSCYVFAVPSGDVRTGDNIRKFNLVLLSETGEVLARISEFSLRILQNNTSQPVEKLYFHHKWQEAGMYAEKPKPEPYESLVVFDGEGGLYEAMKLYSSNTVLVRWGSNYKECGDFIYEVCPGNKEDYKKLFDSLYIRRINHSRLIFRCRGESFVQSADYMDKSFEEDVYPLFYIARAIMEQGMKEKITLLCAYETAEGGEMPQYAALSGFARSLRQENPKLNCRVIELVGCHGKTNSVGIAEKLVTELEQGSDTDIEVRWAEDKRYLKTLIPCESEKIQKKPMDIRENGVYIITGGAGGLGRIFAHYLAHQAQKQGKLIRLVLTGRSEVGNEVMEKLKALEAFGAEIIYIGADVSDRQSVQKLIGTIKGRYGNINGIIHSAGVKRDALLYKKTAEEIKEVLAPKVLGVMWLDEAVSEEPLDFFIMFSSLAGIAGNAGQCDYAYANSFMDYFAERRKRLKRPGKTLSMQWPLWKDGGMRASKEAEALLRGAMGSTPLRTETGLEALEKGLVQEEPQLAVIEGDIQKIKRLFEKEGKLRITMLKTAKTISQIDEEALMGKVRKELIRGVSKILKVNEADIDLDAEMSDFGFDSISFTEYSNLLNEQYDLAIMPSVFFEHPTLSSFGQYLADNFREKLAIRHQDVVKQALVQEVEYVQPLEEEKATGLPAKNETYTGNNTVQSLKDSVNEPIAIIGMGGIMPQSEDLEEFWSNLESGRDMISEIPQDRWDWKALYGDPTTESNKTNIKWGGFMKEIDKFDAAFFGISPREAELMDPQQRIFMETVWHTIEDAGYSPSALSGSSTGLFVGVATIDYTEILRENKIEIQAQTSTGMAHSILANRISYLLDIHGPSEPVDTACSSSLVALHRAVESIRSGDCDMAIAGGVNVIASPHAYIAFSKAGMLSEDGRCKTFDKAANGYVRGEGCGAVLLKPLNKALEDGDNIYAVIRGSSVNHGGHANSLTAPNPNAQADIIANVWRKAGVDPSTISYIEAHGTGTSLGDPIEINGLKKAFERLYSDWGKDVSGELYCGIGSIKTNIGHLETAAGIAGLIKVLLSMKYGKLPGNLHFKVLNPYIQLEGSPFYIVNGTRDWKPLVEDGGREIPRRAGISSFGFGGANAHIALEEYKTEEKSDCYREQGEQLIVISARNEDRLRAYAGMLIHHIDRNTGLGTGSMAYTLQTGRDAMEERVAFIVPDMASLKQKLIRFCDGAVDIEGMYRGSTKSNKTISGCLVEGEEGREFVRSLVKNKRLAKLAQLWTIGIDIDWKLLYDGSMPRRVSLPGYPFEKKRYWFDGFKKKEPKSIAPPVKKQQESEIPQEADIQYAKAAESYMGDEVKLKIIDGNIALVTMQDRKNRNMFSEGLVTGLVAKFAQIRENKDIKAVILSGYENVFCLGGTQEELINLAGKKKKFSDMTFLYKGLLECEVPVIAAVQGHAYGGGLAFGLFADIVVMSEESVYTANFMKYGFTPGLGATFVLKEKLGGNIAAEMMFTAKSFTGQELKDRGASVIFKKQSEVLAEALNIAKLLCEKTAYSVRVLKKELSGRLLSQLPDFIQSEVRMHEQTFSKPETVERINYYFNKSQTGKEKVLQAEKVNEKEFKPKISLRGRGTCCQETATVAESVQKVADEGEIGLRVRQIVSSILHVSDDEIDMEAAFKDMGVDSIIGVEIIRDINKFLGLNLEAVVIYDYPNIKELARYIAKETGKSVNTLKLLENKTENMGGIPEALQSQSKVLLKPKRQTSLPPQPQSKTAALPEPSAAVVMDQDHVRQSLINIISNILHVDPKDIEVEAAFKDMGVDSIIGVEIIRDINKALGLNLEAVVIYDYPNIRELAQFIYREMQKDAETRRLLNRVHETGGINAVGIEEAAAADEMTELLRRFQAGELNQDEVKRYLEVRL